MSIHKTACYNTSIKAPEDESLVVLAVPESLRSRDFSFTSTCGLWSLVLKSQDPDKISQNKNLSDR